MRESVLVLAPQATIRAALARTLTPLGYRVEVASNEKIARQFTTREQFAVAIVAARSAGTQDFALIHELHNAADKLVLIADSAVTARQMAQSFPEALVCSSHRLEHERLCAFLGNPKRTSARAVINDSEFLQFAGRTIDVAGCIVLDANGCEVALTRSEFALLVAFARNPGQVLSRVQLRHAMGGGSVDVYDRSIDMLVARLRRKIEPELAKPQFVITVPGVGYRFIARVQRVNQATSGPAAPSQLNNVREAARVERRQVTILSCQILGFAALAAKLDPEDLHSTIDPVYAGCEKVVARFGGRTLRTLGDEVLVYFGYPKAQENHAESAVRAALELSHVVPMIEVVPIWNFRTRIGIATGMMMVGELPDRGAQRQLTAIGAALNTALHMQKVAPPEGVVIAATTRDLIGHFFLCQEIQPVELDERHEPAPAWLVIRGIAGMPRFEALRRDGMMELVGREAEIERLQQCWTKTIRGAGQVVVLTGEAGIGKSRLVIEAEKRLCHQPHATLHYSGSPHRADASMSVLIDELQRSLGFAAEDAVRKRIDKLQQEFSPLGSAAIEATALSCMLLGLPHETPQDVKEFSPQKRKERTFAVLMARIKAMALLQPVFAVVEDAHWVDPTSLEFLTLVVEQASTMPVFLAIVARPEFAPPWPEHSHVTTLALPRLSPTESAVLIEQVAGERRIPGAIQATIVSRGDGVPLFVEELTKSVLESAGGDARRTPSASVGPIPTTLHGLLLTRFDRLELGKDVAQVAAVIGREFSFERLRIVAGLDEPTLSAALDQLMASGLIFRRGSLPEATFIFKHALARDAAYDMLSRERRQTLHAGAARSLEEQTTDAANPEPELLAYHWREAGDPIKAVGYLLAAAERALFRSAAREALSHLAQARELISTQPANRTRLQLELTFELTSARAFLAARGYTAIETREAYQRAREHCEALTDRSILPLIIHGQWLGAWTAADHEAALERARELYSWAERNQEQAGFAMAHGDLGMSLTVLGRLTEARGHLEEALKINSFALPGRQPFVASDVDGRISALSFMHNCLLLLGFPEKAETTAKEAASLRPQNLYSQVLAQTRALRMRVFERNASAAAEIGAAVLRLCKEQGYPHFISITMIYSGWAMAQCGDPGGGTALCERGLAELRNVGSHCWLPLHLALLAECYAQVGDRNSASQTVAEALQSVETTGERTWEPEIHRLKGAFILSAAGDAVAAADCFITAISKAKAQQTKLLELRAAISLAQLWSLGHKSKQAREVLLPVYESFTEGFESTSLQEAKLVLDSIAKSGGHSPRR